MDWNAILLQYDGIFGALLGSVIGAMLGLLFGRVGRIRHRVYNFALSFQSIDSYGQYVTKDCDITNRIMVQLEIQFMSSKTMPAVIVDPKLHIFVPYHLNIQLPFGKSVFENGFGLIDAIRAINLSPFAALNGRYEFYIESTEDIENIKHNIDKLQIFVAYCSQNGHRITKDRCKDYKVYP